MSGFSTLSSRSFLCLISDLPLPPPAVWCLDSFFYYGEDFSGLMSGLVLLTASYKSSMGGSRFDLRSPFVASSCKSSIGRPLPPPLICLCRFTPPLSLYRERFKPPPLSHSLGSASIPRLQVQFLAPSSTRGMTCGGEHAKHAQMARGVLTPCLIIHWAVLHRWRPRVESCPGA